MQQGSLYDWLGLPAPVYGELGLHLEVVPDERAEQVAARREARERTRDSLCGDVIDLHAPLGGGDVPAEPHGMQDAALLLAARVRADCASLRARLVVLEEACAEIEEEFGGDEVVTADPRELVAAARLLLDAVATDLEPLLGTMPEADHGEVFAAQLQPAVETERER